MRTNRLLNVAIVVVLLAVTAATPAVGAPAGERTEGLDKVEGLVLQELAAQGQADFFVWMAEKADLSPADRLYTKAEKGKFVFEALRSTAERTQAELRAALDARGVRYEAFYIANKILVRGGDPSILSSLAARVDVARITANHLYQLQEPFKNPTPDQVAGVESNISFIKAPQAWALSATGQGTVMAGNDTGLDETHPAIARHYRGCLNPPTCTSWDHNYNWWDATGTYLTNPYDGHNHGTHTTGTMVGDDGAGNQIGVAPGAQTVHCKNMTDGGSGSDATFITCFQWDLAPWDLNHQNPDPGKAPDAINNSWGYSGGNQNQFRDEIQALHAAGILVEVSAGNEGPTCASLRSPGDYWEVLTTGSVSHAATFPGTITSFSSRGPSDLDPTPPNYFPDIMAPGEGIRSAFRDGAYGTMSGTSMAGPHATALVGLIWSACPSLKGQVDQTLAIIRDTATPLTGQGGSNCGGNYTTGPNNDWGYGTIDAEAAVQRAIAQCVGTGTLAGTATDASTGLPLQGVAISAAWSSGGTWTATTSASGAYSLTVPVGQYSVTASKFAYVTQTASGVQVNEGQTTTQNFALAPEPTYTVSGTVTDLPSGAPLAATVSVTDAPISPVTTNPSTGYYQIVVPQGTYTFRVTAELHRAAQRQVAVSGNRTEDYALEPLPCILLVDDDNDAPDTRPYFTAVLGAMGYDYDVFDVGGAAGNGPDQAGLLGYKMVFWFSGDKYGSSAGPNAADSTNLAAYLDAGGRLFLSSQDYLWDYGLTSFGQTYLGIGSYTSDTGDATGQVGVAGDPVGGGLGPYSLTYPSGFTDYGDIVSAGAGASVAFRATNNTNTLDVDKAAGAWKTVFFGTDWVPVYSASAANGQAVLQRIVDWFGGCGSANQPPTAAFSYSCTGLSCSFDGSASSDPDGTITDYAWTFGDGGSGSGATASHTYGSAGTYSVVLTVTDDGGAADTDTQSVTVTAPAQDMHLHAFAMTQAKVGRKYKAQGDATIARDDHAGLAGVLVTAQWTLPNGKKQTQQATTGAGGVATFSVNATVGKAYTLCVTGATLAGWTYVPAKNHVTNCQTYTVVP